MASISYVRAGVSCLPIVGPFVALYNAVEVKRDLSLDRLADPIEQLRVSLIGLRGAFAGFAGRNDQVLQARQDLDAEKVRFRNEHLLICQKGRFYAICGIVGNVLSIATVVGLLALGILGAVNMAIAAASFTFQAAAFSYSVRQHNKNITALLAV